MIVNPFEILLFVACIFSGLSGVFTPDKASMSIQKILPRGLEYVWYIGLILGGILAIYGLAKNLLVARIGITLLLGMCLGYLVILFNASPRPFTFSLFTTLFFCAACVLRIIQINGLLKRGTE